MVTLCLRVGAQAKQMREDRVKMALVGWLPRFYKGQNTVLFQPQWFKQWQGTEV